MTTLFAIIATFWQLAYWRERRRNHELRQKMHRDELGWYKIVMDQEMENHRMGLREARRPVVRAVAEQN